MSTWNIIALAAAVASSVIALLIQWRYLFSRRRKMGLERNSKSDIQIRYTGSRGEERIAWIEDYDAQEAVAKLLASMEKDKPGKPQATDQDGETEK